MKRIIAALSAGLLVTGVFVVGGEAQPAMASSFTINVDCTNDTKISESLQSADTALTQLRAAGTGGPVSYVIDATKGTSFTIQNIGTGACTVARGVGVLTGIVGDSSTIAIYDGAPGGDDALTLVVDDSTNFSISSPTTPAGSSVVLWINACDLPGSGIQQDPWRVASADDFVKIEPDTSTNNRCGLWGHYRQTANFSIDTTKGGRFNPTGTDFVVGIFNGVYDGDHYTINIPPPSIEGQNNVPLFSAIYASDRQLDVPAVVKKLRLTGDIITNNHNTGSVVGQLGRRISDVSSQPGVLSEIRSSVNIAVSSAYSFARVGGIVEDGEAGGLIQYSVFSGSITWESSNSSANGVRIGGLVGEADSFLIRDSYSTGSISYKAPSSYSASPPEIGGLVGGVDNRGDLTILRSYAAGTIQNSCSAECATLPVGGLIGTAGNTVNSSVIQSSYWLTSLSPTAFGTPPKTTGDGDGTPTQPSAYSSGFPVAVGVSADALRTLSTFRTKEGAVAGAPGGSSLPEPGATRLNTNFSDNDYRWAIEPGNVETFVAQKRTGSPAKIGETVTFTRTFDRVSWATSPVPAATYTTRGVASTLAVGTYPALGRVWEICAQENNGFPVLVWEERNCDAGGGGGGNPGGLSDAEYAEFLKSGLTLKEFLARRLAATGTSDTALGFGGLSAVLLGILGAGLVLLARRQGLRRSH